MPIFFIGPQMKKTKISFYLLFISLLTFGSIFIFIVQTSYQKLIGPSQQVEQESLTQPLDPNLDIEVINQIKTRRQFSPQQIVLPTPTSATAASPTTSPSLSPTPSATPSAPSTLTPIPT